MNNLCIEDHRTALEQILSRNASRPTKLMTVPNIASWAAQNQVAVLGDPIGTSLVNRSGDIWCVLLRAEIDEIALAGVLGRLDFRGYWDETAAFRKDPSVFLQHLVLHELAHLENGWSQSQDDKCDEWAFARLAT